MNNRIRWGRRRRMEKRVGLHGWGHFWCCREDQRVVGGDNGGGSGQSGN